MHATERLTAAHAAHSGQPCLITFPLPVLCALSHVAGRAVRLMHCGTLRSVCAPNTRSCRWGIKPDTTENS